MQGLDDKVLTSASNWIANGQDTWLCTVLHTWGSAPRAPGSLLAATADGRFCGSLSGGCIEQSFLQRIAVGHYLLPSQKVRYGAQGLEPDVALPCGGTIELLVEYLPATSASQRYLDALNTALSGAQPLLKTVRCGMAASLEPLPANTPCSPVEQQGETLRITLAPSTLIFIAGLSPVAEYCISYAAMLGFTVLVCEHREEQIRQFRADATLSGQASLNTCFPARYLEQHGCHAHTAILCLTHDARIDDLTLMEASHTPAFYIGVMGSAANSQRRRERLRQIGGLDETETARIHAPVGLTIGSKTPAEIALAIMAEIVQLKNTPGSRRRQVTPPTGQSD